MSRKRSRTESAWLGPALSAGFGAAATSTGYGAFAPAARAFGGWLGQKFKDITGYGDYNVRKNTILSGTVPSLGNASSHPDGMTISHREYLGDVITSPTAGAFSIASYNLNPSDPQTWEWLAQMAGNYEEWVPEGIVFYFKSTSGDALNSTNTALGTVIMATNYNPYNRAFTTKAEMESYEFCSNGSPSSDLMHAIECDPHEGAIPVYFMNTFMIDKTKSASMDARFGTLGTFYIATTGFQGTKVNIGELWVTYQFTFLKPKLYDSLGYSNDSLAFTTPSGGMTNIDPGIMIVSGGYSNYMTLPFTGTTASNGMWVTNGNNLVDIHWPVYAYPITMDVICYVTCGATPVPTVSVTHSVNNGAAAPTTVGALVQAPPATTNTNHMMFYFTVYIPGGYIPMDVTGTPSTRVAYSGALSGYQGAWYFKQVPNMSGQPNTDW